MERRILSITLRVEFQILSDFHWTNYAQISDSFVYFYLDFGALGVLDAHVDVVSTL
jgi:hypothetical protein